MKVPGMPVQPPKWRTVMTDIRGWKSVRETEGGDEEEGEEEGEDDAE